MLCAPIIVYFEFMTGAYRCNRVYYGAILREFLKVIPLTIEIAEKAAEIEAELMKNGCPLDPRNILIAATAIVEKRPLWTRNVRHFKGLKNYGLKLVSRLTIQEQGKSKAISGSYLQGLNTPPSYLYTC